MDHAPSYFDYQPLRAVVRGKEIVHFYRAALGDWSEQEAASLLLAEHAHITPGAHVLQIHCGSGLVGTAIARAAPKSRVTMLDCHLAAIEAAKQTIDGNQVKNATALLSDSASAVLGQSFDVVVALQPKSRLAWEQTVIDAARVLRRGGAFYLAGANRTGIKTAAKFANQIFGHVNVLSYRGSARVLRSVWNRETRPPAGGYYTWGTIEDQVGEQHLAYATKPGLFSWKKLDAGTRLLIETLQANPLHPNDRVLDMGCGSGVLTLAAALQAASGYVLGIDTDFRAVEATQRTLAMNQIAHAKARLGDCGQAIPDRRFAAVVSNPPFHRAQATTYAIAEQIIRDAARVLETRGRLVLVANSFLRYGPIIEQSFGNANLLAQNNQYKVWQAIKQS